MNNSSDIDTLHSQVILLKMRAKTTEELMSILAEKNQKNWSKAECEAAQRVLRERAGKLPEQKVISPQRTTQVKSRRPFDSNEPIGELFSILAHIIILGWVALFSVRLLCVYYQLY